MAIQLEETTGAKPRFAERVARFGSENAFKIAPHIRRVEESGRRVIRCNVGEPDFPLAPHIAAELKRQIDRGETHYVDPQGVDPLRRAVARSVGERRGLHITPDRVVIFPGAKPPIGFAQQVYCDPGDEVIYPSPGFPIYESFTRFLYLEPVPMHLSEENGFACGASQLEPLISSRTRLVYLNFPSNPTGAIASRAQLEEIGRLFLDKAPAEARVYSDEVYEDILYDGAHHESIASVPGMEQRTIIVSGVSKSYAWTGGRIGWAVFPSAEEAAVFRNFNINYFSCVSGYNQLAAAYAIEAPESKTSIAQMVQTFQQRRELVVDGLNAIPGITCHKPGGAFYVFPNIAGVCHELGAVDAYQSLPAMQRLATSPATLFQLFLLFRHGVATLDRRSFGTIGNGGTHYLRLSIATSTEDLLEAVRRLGDAAADRRGFEEFIRQGVPV
ncbi:MAG TPA: aminotransferase class I/II-fold pyridoxal phosphate-dependent enzyme [Thermoanaerobaculia bacterium]